MDEAFFQSERAGRSRILRTPLPRLFTFADVCCFARGLSSPPGNWNRIAMHAREDGVKSWLAPLGFGAQATRGRERRTGGRKRRCHVRTSANTSAERCASAISASVSPSTICILDAARSARVIGHEGKAWARSRCASISAVLNSALTDKPNRLSPQRKWWSRNAKARRR